MATDSPGRQVKSARINGKKTETRTNPGDQTDLAPSRISPWKEEQAKVQKIHIIWDIFAVVSILTFIADVTSDLVVSGLYYHDGSYLWFGLTLGFVLLSSVVMQFFSFKWYREDGKTENRLTYALHFFHLGPVLRYFRMIKSGCQTRQRGSTSSDYDHYMAEWRDISMLRLFEAFLESAPQLVLQLYIMAYHRRFNIENDLFTVIAAGCSLISLSWAIVAYTKALRDLFQDQASVSWFGVLLQILWRLFMVASRVVALVLFAAEYGSWLFVALTLHWFIMALWIIFQKTGFCVDKNRTKNHVYELLFDTVIGFVYIFSFFNVKDGITRIRLISYYCIMLAENTVFVVMWYPARHYYGNLEYPGLTIVWGGFLLGSLCMVIYYNFYHPRLVVKGICVRKTADDEDTNQALTITWCCCCTIQTEDGTPTTVHQGQRQRHTRRQPTGKKLEYSLSDFDVEIVLRCSPSHKHQSDMTEPPVNGYSRNNASFNDAEIDHESISLEPEPKTWV